MANLNLSEFGEKLFVDDADHTFIWDSAVSISKRVSRNSWLNSGTLTSDAPVTISQTWGTTGTYTAFKVVATETLGAAAASNLLELWSGNAATLKAYVSKAGHYVSNNLVNNDVLSNGRWLIKAQASNIGLSWSAGGSGGTTLFNGTGTASLTGDTFNVSVLGFSTSPTAAASDTILVRDSASGNTLGLRNGGAAQTFNVYGTSSSNNTVYERMFMRYSQSALAFQVGTEHLGATSRPLEFFTNGTRKFAIAGSGINTSTFYGHDNTNSSILILRTLSGTAKGQFYVNPSGNCEFGLGFPAAGFPILLSESGNSYFNGGNVGIGTTSPTSKLQVTNGDVEIETVTSGIIMKAAGTANRYRITLNAGGTDFVITAL